MPSLVQNAALKPFWFVFADSGGPRIYFPTQWFQTLTAWKVAPIAVFKLIPQLDSNRPRRSMGQSTGPLAALCYIERNRSHKK